MATRPVRRARRQAEGSEEDFNKGREDGTSMFGSRGREEYEEAEADRTRRREERAARRSSHEDDDEDGYMDSSGSGWGDAKTYKDRTSKFSSRLKFVLDEENVIRVLEPEPVKVWLNHYLPVTKRSYPCLEVTKKGVVVQNCPLCDAGDAENRKAYAAFNVVVLVENGDILEEPVVKILRTPPSMTDALEEIHKGRKGPIDNVYLEVTMYKKDNDFTDYKVGALRDRDLEEDWEDVEPLTEADLEAYRKECVEAKDVLYYPDRKDYAEAVAKLSRG